VNAPVLLTAFYGNNPGAIRTLKKEEEDCAQSTLSLESEECTKTLKPQPYMAGCRVVRLPRVFMVRLERIRFVTATVGCSYELLQAGLELATREST
jgi:hypothetical protein